MWFWFSYLAVGAVLFAVVLASAALNIAIARANQRSVARLAAYETEVVVARDGGRLLAKEVQRS